MEGGTPTPSAPTSAPTGASGGSASPSPTGPGQSNGGPGLSPAESRQSPSGGQATQPKRDPWVRKVRVGDGEAAQEHELDLSEHLSEYKRKLTVMGQEQEVSIDDAFRDYPLAVGAQKKFEAAANMRKEAEAAQATFERQRTAIREGLTDPKRAFGLLSKAMGGDAKVVEWMENHLHERYEYEKLSPQQRALKDAERAREDGMSTRERELNQREQRIKQEDAKRHEQDVKGHFERLKVAVPAALKAGGVPSTPYTIGLYVQVKTAARQQGIEMTDAQAVAAVKREVHQLTQGLVEDPAALREAIGQKGAEAIRKTELERLDEQPGRVAQRTQQAAPPTRQQAPQKKQTLEEFKEERRRESEERQQKWLAGQR